MDADDQRTVDDGGQHALLPPGTLHGELAIPPILYWRWRAIALERALVIERHAIEVARLDAAHAGVLDAIEIAVEGFDRTKNYTGQDDRCTVTEHA